MQPHFTVFKMFSYFFTSDWKEVAQSTKKLHLRGIFDGGKMMILFKNLAQGVKGVMPDFRL